MFNVKAILIAFASVGALLGPIPGSAREPSPEVLKALPGKLLWGDTHLHTSPSNDANMTGNLFVTPEIAYRFAKGEEVETSSGRKARLARSLDFLVVADHVEYLGFLPALRSDSPLDYDLHNELRTLLKTGKVAEAFNKIFYSYLAGEPIVGTYQIVQATWNEQVAAADRHNDPGVFTAIPGYEWTSTPDGDNLHRIVMFREGSGYADQLAPFTNFDSERPEDLWSWMKVYETQTHGQVLAIPHNSNLSNGRMFASVDSAGQTIDAEHAAKRRRWEPIVEVTQIKGDSETHPYLSPNDEFADYWRWDKSNLGGSRAKKQQDLQYEYIRSALKLGLGIERTTGENPFQFGLIGATDSHTGLATADEDNYFGKTAQHEPGLPARVEPYFGKTMADGGVGFGIYSWEALASGYAGVWAVDNTREAIFDAMKRREVYATTGPRILVRFFGGWDFEDADISSSEFAKVGYGKGVPMGGVLPRQPGGSAPAFMVVSAKDSADARLEDRVTGVVPPVGSTVNIADASYTNTIGDAQLGAVWRDPEFDPQQRSFYYVRVLQIPTPRSTAYDAKLYGTQIPDHIPMVIQERAYTSPIWYVP